MERLSGQSLRLILEKKGQLELSHAYHIGIDLLDALDHAHDKGVIHRDVKPDNIFLHRTMAGVTVTKLLDFGIVSLLDERVRETGGRFLGTLRYAAPEQLRGDKPTVKTDVYATALVLYEIIAGRGPFDDEGDPNRIGAAHMNQPPPPVSQFAEVPRALDVLLMTALAKNPDARPRDAFSFAASLRNLDRQREDTRPHVPADLRVTTAAVLSPESSPSLASGVSSPPEARAVVTPGSAPRPSLKTTLAGVPGVASTPPGSTAPNAVDTTLVGSRASTTSSIVATDTLPMPQHGTEALAPSVHPVSLGEADTELQWPPQRLPVPSDEPQVRSLPAPTVHRRAVWPIAATASMIAMAAVIAFRVAPLHLLSASAPVDAKSALVAPAATHAPPSTTRADPFPAPMIPVPAFQEVVAEPAASGAPGRAAPSASPSTAKAAFAPPVVNPPARRSPASTKDRPGPGF